MKTYLPKAARSFFLSCEKAIENGYMFLQQEGQFIFSIKSMDDKIQKVGYVLVPNRNKPFSIDFNAFETSKCQYVCFELGFENNLVLNLPIQVAKEVFSGGNSLPEQQSMLFQKLAWYRNNKRFDA